MRTLLKTFVGTRAASPRAEARARVRSRALLLAILAALTVTPAQATHPTPACDKGPVGWDVFRRLDLLPMLRCGVETKQFSSFNRDGGNVDGQTRYGCFRTDPSDGCVIAEATGPGEIDSIWFTRDRGNVTGNGSIRIDLDGERVLDAPLKDVVDGTLGAPWVFPLVANDQRSSGGNVIKVPMPFRARMRISLDTVRYYHVTWRSFADAGGVATFDPTDEALDVVEILQEAGTVDPKPAYPDAYGQDETFSLPPGGIRSLTADLPGPGVITELAFRFPTAIPIRPVPQAWEETPILAQDVFRDGFGYDYYPNYVPDQTSHALDGFLRNLRMRISVDGAQTVDVPLAEFFGAGTGEYDVSTLLFSMTTALDGWYRAWWPMPYLDDARITLINDSAQTVDGEMRLTMHEIPAITDALADGRAAPFRATSVAPTATTLGRDFAFLDADGQGHVVGVTHTMYPGPSQGLEHDANGVIRTYLEGDERIHLDGSRTPQIHGTGNEDFYEAGWYFNRSTFSNPLNGNPVHEQTPDDCPVGCTGAYRLFVGDAIVFGDGIRMGIEVGAMNDEIRTYSSTTYWYGIATPAYAVTDLLDVGDASSESTHAYAGGGAVETLTATFEGDDDDIAFTDDLRATETTVSFSLSIDPANRGVRLRRLSDQAMGGQAARVLIDGVEAGTWLQPLGNAFHRWHEGTFELPAALTMDASTIAVTIEPLAGTPAWSAARYDALSRV